MKHALIVINGYYKNSNNEYKAKRLKEEFAKLDVECDVKDAISLIPLCRGDTIALNLSMYDFAIDLDKDAYLAKVISLKLPMFNSYESMMLADDKMQSILALYHNGVNVPLTIPAPLCYISNPDSEKLNNFLNQVEQNLLYPLVFKECHGSLGKQVFLVNNREELESIEKKYIAVPHFYEKFLAKHQGNDYRIIVVGNEVVACMERKNDNDFRSNIALGGKGSDVSNSIPYMYKELALKASKSLGLDYAGVDVGTDDEDNPVFIEANGNAFFTEIEKVTNVNIAKIFAEYIVKKLF